MTFVKGKKVAKKNKNASTETVQHRVHEQQHTRQRRSSFQLPDVITMDDLGMMLDEDLYNRIRSLETTLDSVRGCGNVDPRPWEEEVAYARREAQIRFRRKDAHAVYLRETAQDAFESEVGLPSADLDNSRFLKSIGMWN